MVGLCLLAAGCHGVEAIVGTQVKMGFTRVGGLYDAPFPSDDLVRADGTIDLSKFPNPNAVTLVLQGLNLLGREAHGFSTAGAVYFQLTDPLGTQLPSVGDSVGKSSPIFLARCDGKTLERHPVDITFHADGGPFGSPNLLALLPVQGRPLLPRTVYCAAVLRSALDANRKPLGVSLELASIAGGVKPVGLSDAVYAEYRTALALLQSDGIRSDQLAGLTVFTTDDPTSNFAKVKDAILSGTRPVPAPFTLTDTFDDYCVYASQVSMPDYQGGTPPYSDSGGRWIFDQDGNPKVQSNKLSSLFVTIPRIPQPAGGFPLAVLVRAGAGGDRPLVDRGVQPKTGSPAITPGTGPALEFARAGWAGISVDGPLGGLRNPSGADEQFLIYNFFNAGALRDNIRESAVELILLAHLVDDIRLDTSGCPAVGATSKFDLSRMALMGHSTGASIAPLALAFEPRFKIGLLSGAGASFIENVIYKIKPAETRPLAEVLLGYDKDSRVLVAEDPVMTLVEWATEPADAQVYTRRILEAPASGEQKRNILMMQGIVDHYILPRIANGMSLSLGLDLAGEELDAVEKTMLPDQTPLAGLLQWSGRSKIALPAQGNLDGLDGNQVTAVVTQNPEDGIEDGHEVVFQTEAPKRQYRCFLKSFLTGTPRVPAPSADAGCE